MNIIKVHGIRCYSLHGCLKEETSIGGTFEVDFLSGGPIPNECAYFITDNQNNFCFDFDGFGFSLSYIYF